MSKKPDFTQVTFRIGQQATGQAPAEQLAPALSPRAAAGQKGGLRGGRARAAKLTPGERSDAARKAAAARWKRKGGNPGPGTS
jgi:hypothetical protein